ncbi:MAG: hypothetical protein WBM07_09620, partial [Chitinivibrionales bacterium]
MSGNPKNPNVNVTHLILLSRPNESIRLSFVWRYGIIRIENAILTEKYPQATFLSPKYFAVRHISNLRYNESVEKASFKKYLIP